MATYLDELRDEDRVLVVSLPVRIGEWVSRTHDIAGTDRDDRKEAIALEKTLRKIVEKSGDRAFTNDVAEYALASKELWPRWDAGEEGVFRDLGIALSAVDSALPAHAGKSYRKMLYFIAVSVAQASSETGDGDDLSRSMIGGGLVQKILDVLSVKTDLSVPENISDREKAALQKLLQRLKG